MSTDTVRSIIRRLVEAHYFANRAKASAPQLAFLLRELRAADREYWKPLVAELGVLRRRR